MLSVLIFRLELFCASKSHFEKSKSGGDGSKCGCRLFGKLVWKQEYIMLCHVTTEKRCVVLLTGLLKFQLRFELSLIFNHS